MASYLFPYVPNQVSPYVGPVELYGQALQVKDAKFKEQLRNIKSMYDSVLSMPLTNAHNQQTLRAGVQTAMDKLSKTPMLDVGLPENVASIESTFDPILNNQDLIYDTAWTRRYRGELSKAEQLQKNKPELVPPQNLEPLYLAQQNYEQSDPGTRPHFQSFTPYYDFNTKMNTELDKIKADVDNRLVQGKGISITGPDGKAIYIDDISQQQLKEIKEAKVAEVTWNRLHTDAQALNQMTLDYNYNSNHGMYSPSQASNEIDSDLSRIKSQIEGYNLGMKVGELDKSTGEAKIKGLNQKIDDLVNLKNQMKIDPSKAKDYYTFGKTIKDYVEGKVSQYAYTDEGKLDDVPFYGKLRDYQFDILKEQWKAKYDLEKEQAKATLKLSGKSVPTVTPLKNIIIDLEESATGKVSAAPADVQALGNFFSKNGKMYHSFAQNGTNPGDALIIQPAAGAFTGPQIQTLNQAQLLYGLKRDLESLKIKGYAPHPSNDDSPFKEFTFGTFIVFDNTTAKGEDILSNITTNPNYYGPHTAEINKIVEKYSGQLSKLKIDVKDPKSFLQVQNAVKDPQITKAMAVGLTLNDLNGDFQVVTEGNNVTKGESGLLYTTGKIIIPESHLSSKIVSGLLESNMATRWTAGIGTGQDSDEDGKVVKSNEPQIAVNFYKPVSGNLDDINDQMLMNSKRLEGQGENEMYIRENSRAAMKDFYKTIQESDSYSFPGAKFVRRDDGTYTIDQTTADNKPLLSSINSMAWDISVRTGVDAKKVQQDVTGILAINRLPLRRAEALNNYESNLNTQNNILKQNFGTSNINPNALKTWSDIASEFPVTNLGFWGDEAHKLRASDHNSGDAVDMGVQSVGDGNQITEQLKSEASQRNIKYIIFNGKIWNPSVSNEWRAYTGANNHSNHIHVSFN